MTAGTPTGARVVWSGRFADELPDGLDGWSTDAPALAVALDAADELVVLDPLSFPWRSLQGRRDLPVAVRLPHELTADEVDDLLGRPLLRHLGRHDRVLDDRDDHRRLLSERHDLPAEVWLPAAAGWDEHLTAPDGDVERRHRDKAAERQLVADVVADLDAWLDGHPDGEVEVFAARSASIPVSALRRASAHRIRRHGAPSDELHVPSPEGVLVWLDDGAPSGDERVDLVGAAARRVRVGGRIAVLAFVVDRPGGPANPGIHRLVEDVAVATHGALHVDEVRSLRLGAEPWARVVLLGGTRLGPGDPA
ncbi:hypothetical protein ABFT23_15695 [Nocardioides sp. C4-1]|uniref:hypothetical protein n=1 Tax=Nocardioides sp. C4-1 TaxID=3151851 RepID=UPI0032670FEA